MFTATELVSPRQGTPGTVMNRLFFVMGVVFLALLELAAGRHSHDSKSTDESEAECGSSEDCGLARPLCHEGQCIGISCDAHGLDGLWDDDWDGRPPIVGNFSISYFRYISKLGCLCMFNDWVSSLQRICDDNYGFFQLTLRHGVGGWEDGVLETWEFYLFGDASSIIVRDGFIVQHRKKVNHLVGVGFSGSPNMEKSHTTYELCFAVERGASVKVSLADAVSGEPNSSACVSSLPQQEPLEMVVAIPTDESDDHRVSAIPLPGGIAPATVISGTLSLTMRVGSAGLAPFTGLAPSPWAWLCLQWGLAVTLKLPPWLVAVNNVSNTSLDTLIVKYGITYPSAAFGVVPVPLSSDDIQDRAKSCVKDTANMLLRYGQASWGTSLLSCTLDHPTQSHQCVTSSQCPTKSRPLCQNGVCVEMSCPASDSGVLIDGIWEDAWEGLVPSTGEHSLVYALFYPTSSCVCLFNDWLDNFGRTCADNSHLYNFTLTRGNGWVLRSGETWELQLFGDGEVAVSRDGLTIRSRGPGGDLAVSTFDSSPNLKERHTTAEVCFPGEAGSTYEISIADPVSASSFTGQCINDGPQKEPAAISVRLPTNDSTLNMVGKPTSALGEGGSSRGRSLSLSLAVWLSLWKTTTRGSVCSTRYRRHSQWECGWCRLSRCSTCQGMCMSITPSRNLRRPPSFQ